MPVFGAKRPAWRNHRSATREASSNTTVTVLPAMNNGFNLDAPTSEIKLRYILAARIPTLQEAEIIRYLLIGIL